MPILHCSCWKVFALCYTQTHNTFPFICPGNASSPFVCTETLQVDHVLLPLHSWGKVWNADIFWINQYWEMFLLKKKKGYDDFFISDVREWLTAHSGEVLKDSVWRVLVQYRFQIFKNTLYLVPRHFCTVFLTNLPAFNGTVQCW